MSPRARLMLKNLRSHCRNPAFVMVLGTLAAIALVAAVTEAWLMAGSFTACGLGFAWIASQFGDDDPQHPVPGWDPRSTAGPSPYRIPCSVDEDCGILLPLIVPRPITVHE